MFVINMKNLGNNSSLGTGAYSLTKIFKTAMMVNLFSLQGWNQAVLLILFQNQSFWFIISTICRANTASLQWGFLNHAHIDNCLHNLPLS